MVSLDCKELVLAHIRNCFLTADDQGFCELLFSRQLDLEPQGLSDILNEDFVLPLIDTDADDFSRFSPECPYVESQDPIAESGGDGRCPPSGQTIICSSPMAIPKQACKMKNLTKTDIDHYFPVTTPNSPVRSSEVSPKKSCLTLALEQAQADGRLARSNVFADYCVHDARPTRSISEQPVGLRSRGPIGRQFTVWLWQIAYVPRVSLCVQPRLDTTVRQFVGLVLWQYFNQLTRADAPPGLFEHLDRFDDSLLDRISVYHMDSPEEGVDSEFPPLDSTDRIHKYEFDSLALIEQSVPQVDETRTKEVPLVLVTVHMTQGISTFRFPADTPLSAVLQRAMQRRQLPQHGGYQYHLESWPHTTDQHTQRPTTVHPQGVGWNKPGDSSNSQGHKGQRLDLSLRLSEVVATQLPLRFVLVRDHSRCDPAMVDSDDEEETAAAANRNPTPSAGLHATLQLRQYRVTLLGDVPPREVQLNVSKDGIKIDQVAPSFRRPKFFSRSTKSPLLYPVDSLADCVLVQSPAPSTGPRDADNEHRNAGGASSGEPRARAFSTGKVQLRIVYMASSETDSATHSALNLGQKCGPDPADMTVLDTSTGFGDTDKVDDLSLKLTAPHFQTLCFETQWSRAQAIRDQVTMILECCASKARRLYMQQVLATG